MYFGAAINSTCHIWQRTCGKRGNCYIYNNDQYRYYFVGMGMICMVLTTVFTATSYFTLPSTLKKLEVSFPLRTLNFIPPLFLSPLLSSYYSSSTPPLPPLSFSSSPSPLFLVLLPSSSSSSSPPPYSSVITNPSPIIVPVFVTVIIQSLSFHNIVYLFYLLMFFFSSIVKINQRRHLKKEEPGER